jgi:Ca2+-binding RTX toxin-like protein
VTITVHGKDSAGDELWGNGTDNSINDQFDDDVFRLGQGGDDTVNGFGGNDAFAFGAAFTDLDVVDGGAGFDTIVLAGDYFSTPLVLSPTGVTNVERILVLSDPLLAGFSYDITTDDTNVAAGEVLIVDASGLSSIEELLFDGSAETDGRFLLIGGGCDDELRGGAGDDVLIGGADFNTLDGNGGIDRVDYSLVTGPVDVDLGSGVANDNGLGGADALEEIENATGSAFADVLVGSNVANVLDGGMGADQMTGGDGDDTYVVDNVGDTVSETSAAVGSTR